MKRSPLRRAGKRVKAWTKTRVALKKEFFNKGLTVCELRYEGCAIDNYLGFAHSRKRRNINSPELMTEVIICCNFCHNSIEILGEEKMHKIVTETIERRGQIAQP